jgi:hypothetical protein
LLPGIAACAGRAAVSEGGFEEEWEVEILSVAADLLTLTAEGSAFIMARGDSVASCGWRELVPGTEVESGFGWLLVTGTGADGGFDARSMVDCDPFVAVMVGTCICFAGVTTFVACGVP